MAFLTESKGFLTVVSLDRGELVHLCGICGFVLSGPNEPCPRCALLNEDAVAAIDGQRVAKSVEDWLKQKQPPHPLEAELAKLQATLDALDACPPLWWADKLLWRGLRWFYKMRQRRARDARDKLVERGKKGHCASEKVDL